MDGSVLHLQRLKVLIESRLGGLGRPGKLDLLLAWKQTCRLLPEHGYGPADLDIGEAYAFWCPEDGFGFHEICDIALIAGQLSYLRSHERDVMTRSAAADRSGIGTHHHHRCLVN